MVTYGIRSIWPHKFNYPDGLTDLITYSPLVFVMFGVVVFLLGLVVWFQKREKYPVRYFTICGYASCIILVFVLVGFVILGTINTVYPGKLGSWSELSALTFNWEWGSYRGAAWVAGIRCFSEQNLIGKLLGVGPDSMAFYLHSGADPGLLAMINECFQGRLLTNAHCEWLTIMVNNGLLGVFCYAGIFISIIVRCLKNSTQQPIAGACGFAVLAYTVNNVFSFQQVVSAVTIFIVMGMGEAFLRKEAS